MHSRSAKQAPELRGRSIRTARPPRLDDDNPIPHHRDARTGVRSVCKDGRTEMVNADYILAEPRSCVNRFFFAGPVSISVGIEVLAVPSPQQAPQGPSLPLDHGQARLPRPSWARSHPLEPSYGPTSVQRTRFGGHPAQRAAERLGPRPRGSCAQGRRGHRGRSPQKDFPPKCIRHHPRADMTFPTEDGIMPPNLIQGAYELHGL